MADNIANILPPSSLRLSVEPVELELEASDASLLFSALQSAFPQSTGIYFRPKGADCRVMLKFDGRRFLPPNGGWNNSMDYFVELGGSRHNSFPFGSYEHASKQFERSVSLVQQMMNSSMMPKGAKKSRQGSGGGVARMVEEEARLDDRQQESRLSPHPAMPLSPDQCGDLDGLRGEMAMDQRSRKPSSACRKSSAGLSDFTLTSSMRDVKHMERDFADLARICAGKDAVIDGQRVELDGAKKQLEMLRGVEEEWKEREAEWSAKWEAAERELEMLRALGRDQEGLHGQIVELGQKLEEGRAAWERARGELEMEARKWQREAQEWKDKNELATWTTNELNEQLRKVQRERGELQKKAAILEEQVNGEAMEFGRRFQERERVQQELLADNTRLYQIKEQLEKLCGEFKAKLAGAEADFGGRLKVFRAEYEKKEEKLRENLVLADAQIAQLEAKLKELASEKAKAEEQLKQLRNHSELGNSEPLFAYSQG